jgi:hypothetical protein
MWVIKKNHPSTYRVTNCLFTGSVEDPVRGARKGKKNIQAGKAKIASVEEFSQRLQKVESK